MHLLFATQVVDADDEHLAQTLDMVRALARRADRVTVLCDRVGRHDLPGNVELETFGARGKLGRALRFERALLRAGRPDAFLAHMVPRFLVLAAPLLRPRGVPLLLWYTHWHASRELRLATRLCDAALSVHRDSYPLASPKVRGIGHAIDLDRFAPRQRAGAEPPLRLLALGRTEPRKRLDVLLDAVELAAERGLAVQAEIRGPQVNERERAHRRELERRIAASDVLRRSVQVADGVPRDAIPELLRGADALVSLTRGDTAGGALDKVVYEAAACAVPALACNENFADVLGGHGARLLVRAGDAADLVDALAALAALDAEARTRLGAGLRARVEERHSAASWAEAVLALAGSRRSSTSSA